MSRYEISRTNGSYGGLSAYHGLGDGKGKGHGDKGRGRGPGGLAPFSKDGGSSASRGSPFAPFMMPSAARSQIMEQRSIQTAQRAERVEQRGESALTAGRDSSAQNLMALANRLDTKSNTQAGKAQQLRLPYTDLPLMPKGLIKQADVNLYDTPVKIADQLAPLPEDGAPVPTTAPATTPARLPITLPLMPPPLLLAPGVPGPQMVGPPMAGPPMIDPRSGPARRPFMGGRISPANAAAATAALAASYFLFF